MARLATLGRHADKQRPSASSIERQVGGGSLEPIMLCGTHKWFAAEHESRCTCCFWAFVNWSCGTHRPTAPQHDAKSLGGSLGVSLDVVLHAPVELPVTGSKQGTQRLPASQSAWGRGM